MHKKEDFTREEFLKCLVRYRDILAGHGKLYASLAEAEILRWHSRWIKKHIDNEIITSERTVAHGVLLTMRKMIQGLKGMTTYFTGTRLIKMLIGGGICRWQ